MTHDSLIFVGKNQHGLENPKKTSIASRQIHRKVHCSVLSFLCIIIPTIVTLGYTNVDVENQRFRFR